MGLAGVVPAMNRVRALVPTWAEARTLARWISRGPGFSAGDWRDAPDSDRADHLASPFTSIPDVLDRLGELEADLRAADDRRAVFLSVYTRMTEQVQTEIDAGGFEDADWVSAYLVAFADEYRRAFVAYERGDYDAVPWPWLVAFDAALTGDMLVVQDALLGVNAHINYDLTDTLHTVGIDPDRPTKRADHDHVNAILASLVDTIQDTLVDVYDALGVSDIDSLLGRFDEYLVLAGMAGGRDVAWANAVLLADTPAPFGERFVQWRRALSGAAAEVVRRSTPSDTLLDSIRGLESDAGTAASFAEELDRHISAQADDTSLHAPPSDPEQ